MNNIQHEKRYSTPSWKGEFINDLIRDLEYKKYLELGVATADTWNQIACEYKVGVDSANESRWKVPNIISATTDAYFDNKTSNDNFDLIYIDACHEKTQVKKDFYNSWNILNNRGLILLHDINPPSKEGTSQSAHGDCFELWIKLVDCYPENVAVFNAERGTAMNNNIDTLGLFFKSNESVCSSDIQLTFGTFMDYDYSYFIKEFNTYNQNLSLSYEQIIDRALKTT